MASTSVRGMSDTPKPQIAPHVWTPPPHMALDGPFARNEALAAAEVWPVPGVGPEDVVVDGDGVVWTGTADGSILGLDEGGDRIRRVARTGGRPLGIELLGDGRLLVCDADRGLLAVDPASGAIEDLVTEVDGVGMVFTNNAAVAADGTIWFTDSSTRFSIHHYEADLLEHSGTGRLLRRDPDGTVEVVVDGLFFANGVALSPDESFLLVAETGMYHLTRLWLTGDRAGQREVFIELPGFPDNLSTGPTGTFWCALASDRNKLIDTLASKPPVLRKMAWAAPEALQPAPAAMALVVGLDADANVTHNLQTHGGDFVVATGAREHDGHLYVGSLVSDAILRATL